MSHDRALALVPVAAATEYQMQCTGDVGKDCRQHGFQCFGLMGVIDKNGRTIRVPDGKFKASAHTGEGRQTCKNLRSIDAGGDHNCACGQCIRGLKETDQGQLDGIFVVSESDG